MKRALCLLLCLSLLLGYSAAFANESNSLRNPGVKETYFDIEEEQSVGKLNKDGTTVSAHSDFYLFVDPTSALHVTIVVIDEQGWAIPGAKVWLCEAGHWAYWGKTDQDGKLMTYLFEDSDYKIRVAHKDYELYNGSFRTGTETQTVYVVLVRKYPFELYVHGQPGRHQVLVEGEPYTAICDEKLGLDVLRMVYDIDVLASDGRWIPTKVQTKLLNKYHIDLTKNNLMADGSVYHDQFLVFDRDYRPEDYLLTYLDYNKVDFPRIENETDEQYEARHSIYLQKHPNTLLIEAECDHIRKERTDYDVLDEEGNPVWSQRSLMPTGWLFKRWEADGYQSVLFTNENAQISFDIKDLHGANMTKLFRIMAAIHSDENLKRLLKTEVLKNGMNPLEESGLLGLGVDSIEPRNITFDSMKDYAFKFDTEALEDEIAKELMEDKIFETGLFEFRITPVTDEGIRDIITRQYEKKQGIEILYCMTNPYAVERLHLITSRGRITQEESNILYPILADGILDDNDFEQLRLMYEADTLTDDILYELFPDMEDALYYRLGAYLTYYDQNVEITSLLPSLRMSFVQSEQSIIGTTETILFSDEKSTSVSELNVVSSSNEKDPALTTDFDAMYLDAYLKTEGYEYGIPSFLTNRLKRWNVITQYITDDGLYLQKPQKEVQNPEG